MTVDPRVVNHVCALKDEEQERIILQLTDYAAALIRSKTKWIARGALPAGHEASDLALEAIRRVLDGTRRWNPDADPDLLRYLKSVVKSIFWDLLKSAEREALKPPLVDGEDAMELIASEAPGPDGVLLAVEEETEARCLRNRMLAALDETEDQLVLLCMLDGNEKASTIASDLGIPVTEVYRRKRRIKMCLFTLKEVK